MSFGALAGSDVTVSGGRFGNFFDARNGSDVKLVGSDFRLDGTPVGPGATVADGEVLSGTFEDGNVFIVTPLAGGGLSGISLVSGVVAPADLTPIVIDDSADVAPAGLRLGQSLTLLDEGLLRQNFNVAGGSIDVHGGVVDFGLRLDHATARFSGGTIRAGVDVLPGSTASIHGGSFQTDFDVHAGGTLSIYGRDFAINGEPISGLTVGQASTIAQRDATLTAVLADGSPFVFQMVSVDNPNSTGTSDPSYVSPLATLTVTLVPEPTALMQLVSLAGAFFAARKYVGSRKLL